MIERLFIGVWLDRSATEALEAIPRLNSPGIRWVPPDRWHITLRFVGDCELDEVVERLAVADLPPSRARLGPRVDMLGRHLIVPVDGLDGLAGAVRRATDDLGVRDDHSFSGHVTIGRTTNGASPVMVGHRVGVERDVEWDVSEIVVVASELTPDGAIYTSRAAVTIGPADDGPADDGPADDSHRGVRPDP